LIVADGLSEKMHQQAHLMVPVFGCGMLAATCYINVLVAASRDGLVVVCSLGMQLDNKVQ